MKLEYREAGYNDAIIWDRKNILDSRRNIGPCIIYNNGTVYFGTSNGTSVSRRVGPAAIYPSGRVRFYEKSGYRHRTTGPSVIYPNGAKTYYIDNCSVSELEYFATYGVL